MSVTKFFTAAAMLMRICVIAGMPPPVVWSANIAWNLGMTKVRRKKTSEKFMIVQKVLPQIAAKSALILNKPVPILDSVITKIMDVVWIDWKSEFVPKPARHKVTVSIYNYTARPRKMNIYAVVPQKSLNEKSVSPPPTVFKDDTKLEWELKAIASVQKQDISFELTGLDKDEFDELELYGPIKKSY